MASEQHFLGLSHHASTVLCVGLLLHSSYLTVVFILGLWKHVYTHRIPRPLGSGAAGLCLLIKQVHGCRCFLCSGWQGPGAS